VLCKHEVVGSIPSGSTRLRSVGFVLIKFRFSAMSLRRVIIHRKEEIHPVGLQANIEQSISAAQALQSVNELDRFVPGCV
jgi:hypothetical protein